MARWPQEDGDLEALEKLANLDRNKFWRQAIPDLAQEIRWLRKRHISDQELIKTQEEIIEGWERRWERRPRWWCRTEKDT